MHLDRLPGLAILLVEQARGARSCPNFITYSFAWQDPGKNVLGLATEW